MIQNRILSQLERSKLHDNENKVISCYERITKQKFMRFEMVLVKRCIRSATPEQINAIIVRMYRQYPQNFKDFAYVVQPVERMFKSRRGKGRKEE